jgi:ATPase family protein associated with various cellular activities (AAA)
MMTFDEIEDLRRALVALRREHIDALKHYYDPESNGFSHKLNEKKLSKASTATCVASLAAARKWTDQQWGKHSRELATTLLREEWSSADLPPENAFTTAFILECVTILEEQSGGLGTFSSAGDLADLATKATTILKGSIADGGARIEKYPPTAYVTQLVARTLARRGSLAETEEASVRRWAEQEIVRQIAAHDAGSKESDPYQLAYSAILIISYAPDRTVTPDQIAFVNLALARFFAQQLPDGSWPRSRPLFHYPSVGSAYCYEFELLVQLLSAFQSRRQEARLLPYLGSLKHATESLSQTFFRLDEKSRGWSSGHHPQLPGPESWSTASVFHFAHAFDRLLAEAVRLVLFRFVRAPYSPPTVPSKGPFAPDFLDSSVHIDGKDISLRQMVEERFVKPLAANAEAVRDGVPLPKEVATSAIFYGPPGTSKTSLAEQIADYLGWPALLIDPSHLVRRGMDLMQAEANELFRMLAETEQVVVLLDEFDEMVRERETEPEALSRFLTTAMLPKLIGINKQRRLVFIVATNHIERFDTAIRRPGRFDAIIQIMPPTAEAKLAHWPDFQVALRYGITQRQLEEKIAGLTFDETRMLLARLRGAQNLDHTIELLDRAKENSTMHVPVATGDGEQTWAVICDQQKTRSRLP